MKTKQHKRNSSKPENQTANPIDIIVEHFQNLSQREKMLIEAHAKIQSMVCGDLHRRLQEAIELKPDYVPESSEEKWLYAVLTLSAAAA